MGRKKEINPGRCYDGIMEVELAHWKHFPKFISRDIQQHPAYIFRGQSKYSWRLESSYDRLVRLKKEPHPDLSLQLQAFKHAARGRRGANPQVLTSENEWWALGQHFGLATPLLDFTRSAFVALYFAFWDESEKGDYRSVHALHAYKIKEKNKQLIHAAKNSAKAPDLVEVFYPSSDENIRLINQSGLFVKMPVGRSIETWVKKHFAGETETVLIKIKIPNQDLADCLTMLNRMNINHSTLFPDLYGSAKYVNSMLGKTSYDYLPYLE